jgi:hypothetical protein
MLNKKNYMPTNYFFKFNLKLNCIKIILMWHNEFNKSKYNSVDPYF